MKRGFTLLELQVSLLLTVVLMSLLFLFTFYFWRNHHDHQERLRFQREGEGLISWVNGQMRNAQSVKWDGPNLVFTSLSGEKEVLEFEDMGPKTSGSPFFSQPVRFDIRLYNLADGMEILLQVEQGGREFSFRQLYPLLPNPIMGRTEL